MINITKVVESYNDTVLKKVSARLSLLDIF